jgi:membrane-associated phospholipid phosphatase
MAQRPDWISSRESSAFDSRTATALAGAAAVSVLLMAFADRSLAVRLNAGYRHTSTWLFVDRAFGAIEVMFFVVLGVAIIATLVRQFGRPLPRWADIARRTGIAALAATIVVVTLKVLLGRSWPDPTFFQSGVYEFSAMHGRWTLHEGSFPSGTACIAAAMATMLWAEGVRYRAVAVMVAGALSLGVVVQNYHWISDALFGAVLGVVVARVILARGDAVVATRLRSD